MKAVLAFGVRAEAAGVNGTCQPIIDWAVVDCLVGSGIRSHELADLQVGDLRIGHGESSIVVRHGKGDKARVVAISDRLKRHLAAFLRWKQSRGEAVDPEAPLFRSERGGKLCTRAVRHLFKRCLLRAGLDKRLGVHSLRHFHLSARFAQLITPRPMTCGWSRTRLAIPASRSRRSTRTCRSRSGGTRSRGCSEGD
jgi:integrase